MTERIVDKVMYQTVNGLVSDSLTDADSVLKAIKIRTPAIEVTDTGYGTPNTLTKQGLSITSVIGDDEQTLTHLILKNLIIMLTNTELFPNPTVADAGKILHVADDGSLAWQSPIISIDGGSPSTPCIYNVDGGVP